MSENRIRRGTVKPRFWIRLTVGPWPVRIALYIALAAVAVAAWSVTKVVGDESRISNLQQKTIEANIRARFDDCMQGNTLRQGITLIARQQQLPDSVVKKLFPNVPISLIQKSHATFRLELQIFKPRNCSTYAREALPRVPH